MLSSEFVLLILRAQQINLRAQLRNRHPFKMTNTLQAIFLFFSFTKLVIFVFTELQELVLFGTKINFKLVPMDKIISELFCPSNEFNVIGFYFKLVGQVKILT
jgi:hypothetical protein